MSVESVRSAVAAAVHGLVAAIPPAGAATQRRADYQLRKAETLDLIAATYPSLAVTARTMATRARREATRLTRSRTDTERGDSVV